MNATLAKPTNRADRKARILSAAIKANVDDNIAGRVAYNDFDSRARTLWDAACASREIEARTRAYVMGRNADEAAELSAKRGLLAGGKTWTAARPIARAAWAQIVAADWWTDGIRTAVRS